MLETVREKLIEACQEANRVLMKAQARFLSYGTQDESVLVHEARGHLAGLKAALEIVEAETQQGALL